MPGSKGVKERGAKAGIVTVIALALACTGVGIARQARPSADAAGRARVTAAVEPVIDAVWKGYDQNAAMDHVRFMSRYWRLAGNTGYNATVDRLQKWLATAGLKTTIDEYPNGGPAWDYSTGTLALVTDGKPDQVVLSREQDQLALESHRKAAAAYEEGFFDDLVVEFRGLKRDNNVRRDTSLEKLAALKPSFDRQGTLTAGNSTPMTDGSAAVLLASEEWAKARGLPVLAYLKYGKYAAVDFIDKEGLLMAPAYAVPRMLADAGMKLQDFDFYEIHEAFEAQVLCTLKAWQSPEFCRERLGLAQPLGTIDRSKMNVKGGSVAIGHPFAATGARILATLAKLLATRGNGRGLISICTAGGMGVTAILER